MFISKITLENKRNEIERDIKVRDDIIRGFESELAKIKQERAALNYELMMIDNKIASLAAVND